MIKNYANVIYFSLKISYCTILTLLVMTWDDTMPSGWDEVKWGEKSKGTSSASGDPGSLIHDNVDGWRSWAKWNWTVWDQCATQNSAKFKTYALLISGTFCLIFSEHGVLRVTETVEKSNHRWGGITIDLNSHQ